MFEMGAASTSLAASSFATVLPSSRVRCSPVAVVTTSSSTNGTWLMMKSAVTDWPPVTAMVRTAGPYPTRLARNWCVPAGTARMVKTPESFVSAPMVLPVTTTAALGTGRPVD